MLYTLAEKIYNQLPKEGIPVGLDPLTIIYLIISIISLLFKLYQWCGEETLMRHLKSPGPIVRGAIKIAIKRQCAGHPGAYQWLREVLPALIIKEGAMLSSPDFGIVRIEALSHKD